MRLRRRLVYLVWLVVVALALFTAAPLVVVAAEENESSRTIVDEQRLKEEQSSTKEERKTNNENSATTKDSVAGGPSAPDTTKAAALNATLHNVLNELKEKMFVTEEKDVEQAEESSTGETKTTPDKDETVTSSGTASISKETAEPQEKEENNGPESSIEQAVSKTVSADGVGDDDDDDDDDDIAVESSIAENLDGSVGRESLRNVKEHSLEPTNKIDNDDAKESPKIHQVQASDRTSEKDETMDGNRDKESLKPVEDQDPDPVNKIRAEDVNQRADKGDQRPATESERESDELDKSDLSHNIEEKSTISEEFSDAQSTEQVNSAASPNESDVANDTTEDQTTKSDEANDSEDGESDVVSESNNQTEEEEEEIDLDLNTDKTARDVVSETNSEPPPPPKPGSLASFFEKVNKNAGPTVAKDDGQKDNAAKVLEHANPVDSRPLNESSDKATDTPGLASQSSVSDSKKTDDSDYGYTSVWGRKQKHQVDESLLHSVLKSQAVLNEKEADSSSPSEEEPSNKGKDSDGRQSEQGGAASSIKGGRRDVNSEFVKGLDDIDKFMEAVDAPDELDVSAAGGSMQEVLVGQAAHIIRKHVVQGTIRLKNAFANFGFKEFWESRKGTDDQFVLIRRDEFIRGRNRFWGMIKGLAKTSLNTSRRFLDELFEADDSDDPLTSQLGLTEDKDKLDSIRKRFD